MSYPEIKGAGAIILGNKAQLNPQEQIQLLVKENVQLQKKLSAYHEANEDMYREVQDLQMLLAIAAYQSGGTLIINPELMEHVDDHEIVIVQNDEGMLQVTLTQSELEDIAVTEPTLFS